MNYAFNSIRAAVKKLSAYIPGEKAADERVIILNANENPYPPSPQVITAIHAAMDNLRWYPESSSRDARITAAEVYQISPNNVMLTNSSDEMLRILAQSCVNENDLVYAFTPSFTFYKTLSAVQGADFREIVFPDDYTLPELPADFSRAKLIFFPNPGAPSSVVYDLTAIRKIIDSAGDAIVVIDEAYADFDRNRHSALPLLNDYKNLIIVRTFSKSYALAGLRIGLGLAAPELLSELHKVRDYYNLDRLAQAAATAALRDQDYLHSTCEKIIATREWFVKELTPLVKKIWQPAGNFVLARFGDNASEIYQQLKARKILVRYWNAPRLTDCLRITIGADHQMRTLLTALRELLA